MERGEGGMGGPGRGEERRRRQRGVRGRDSFAYRSDNISRSGREDGKCRADDVTGLNRINLDVSSRHFDGGFRYHIPSTRAISSHLSVGSLFWGVVERACRGVWCMGA